MTILRVGSALFKAYCNSLIWFSIGVISGGIWVAIALVGAGLLK